MPKGKSLKPISWTIPLSIALLLSFFLNIYLLLNPKKETANKISTSRLVTRVIDGDTFDIEGNVRIRLAGADAPEYPKDCLSEQAKKRLDELITGQKVQINELDKDQFGRTLAFVFRDGLFIDKTMVEEGLAYAQIENPNYGPQLATAQELAIKAQRGIWSSTCTAPPEPDCVIKGNIRTDTGTKIYHLPFCYNYDKIVIKQSEGDRWFCSEEEAKLDGFIKSQDCPEQ